MPCPGNTWIPGRIWITLLSTLTLSKVALARLPSMWLVTQSPARIGLVRSIAIDASPPRCQPWPSFEYSTWKSFPLCWARSQIGPGIKIRRPIPLFPGGSAGLVQATSVSVRMPGSIPAFDVKLRVIIREPAASDSRSITPVFVHVGSPATCERIRAVMPPSPVRGV